MQVRCFFPPALGWRVPGLCTNCSSNGSSPTEPGPWATGSATTISQILLQGSAFSSKVFFFCWFFVFKQGFSHVPLLCVNNVNITCLSNELPRLFPGQSVPWTEGALLVLVNLLTVQSLHPHSASCACLWSPASSACYAVGDRMVPPLPSPSLSLLGCLGSRPQGTCRLSVCSGP